MGYNENSLTHHEKATYPIVLYPNILLEINRLQPPLSEKPQEPSKPQKPYKPSEKYKDDFPAGGGCLIIGLLALFFIIIVGGLGGKLDVGALFIFLLTAIICIPFGIYLIIDKWKDNTTYENEYPEKLAKYNVDMKHYQREEKEYEKKMEEYKNQCSEYEKDKEKTLSPHHVQQYRYKIMRERLWRNVKPSLSLTMAKKGVSESYFYSLLIEHFGGKIQTDLSFTQNEKTYFPDFVYCDSSTNLIIDIEIDEPYTGYSGSPIHYIINRKDYYSEKITTTTVDDERDREINKGGWIIVKFAEQQIFEDASGCMNFLSFVIENAKKMIFNYSNKDFPTPISRWTKDEAHGMGYKRFRFSYVPEKYHKLLDVDGDYIVNFSEKKEETVEKIIDKENEKQIQSFLKKHTNLSTNIISNNYPLPYYLFDKHKNKLNWIGLSDNPYLPWSMELIEKYVDKWDWKILSNNKSLPWTIEFLEKYKDKLDWTILCVRTDGRGSILKELWNCREWSEEWAHKMEDLLGFNYMRKLILDVHRLEAKTNNIQTQNLTNEYDSDEKAFILCQLLRDYDSYFILKSRQWDVDYFENFRNHEWAWKGLSANEKVEWNIELIEKYMDKWDLNELARNKSVYEIFKQHLSNSLIETIMTKL